MHDETDPDTASPYWSHDTDIMPIEIQEAGLDFSGAIDKQDLDAAVDAFNKIIKWYPEEIENVD